MPEGWDQTRFDQAFVLYQEWSSRTYQEICNTKAYFVARKALWFTVKTDANSIKSTLGGFVSVQRVTKRGKVVKRREVRLVQSTQVNAPLAALIINKRRGKKGLVGLALAAMALASRELLAGRNRSIAFIKSGWLESIQELAKYADTRSGAAPMDRAAKRVGVSKGYAIPAQAGFVVHATIVNAAIAKHDKKDALQKFGGPALQRAFDDEAASMMEYVERKMIEDAERANRLLA